MGCFSTMCRKLFVGILSLIKVAICVTIICIVTLHLYHINFKVDADTQKIDVRAGCLMTGSVNGDSICEYTYAVCGLSMLLSFISSLLLCITCDLCGLGDWLEFIVGALQTAWWVIASIIITKNVRESNDFVFPNGSGMPSKDWRNAVAVLAWINVMIAGLLSLIFLCQACKCLRSCFCCCGDDDDDDRRNKV